MDNMVGVLGGIGPLATVYFMDMVIEKTKAEIDQDHINMVVLNHATIPDRTEYIMGRSNISPLEYMVQDAKLLESIGCSFIVIPCNTAHYFVEEIEASIKIPVINIIIETLKYAIDKIVEKTRKLERSIKIGVMATEGTICSGTYSFYGNHFGVECIAPEDLYQKKINRIIYEGVKAGKHIKLEDIMEIIDYMRNKKCDVIIMGCTELSIIYKDLKLYERCDDIVDSLSVLAYRTILKCGKQIK